MASEGREAAYGEWRVVSGNAQLTTHYSPFATHGCAKRSLEYRVPGTLEHVEAGAAVGLFGQLDALALHQDDLADVEDQQALEPRDLVPQPRRIVGGLVEVDVGDRGGQGRAPLPDLLEGRNDLLVQAGRLDSDRPGPAQQLEASRPEAAARQLGVVELEQIAGAPLLPGIGETARQTEIPVDVGRIGLDLGEPVLFEIRDPSQSVIRPRE